MASGRRAFKGDSAVETMNAALKSEPPETEGTLTGIGLGLVRVLRHCLERTSTLAKKDPSLLAEKDPRGVEHARSRAIHAARARRRAV